MKQILEDPEKMVDVMERFYVCHNLMTAIRKELRDIEAIYFSLIGEQFGDLIVRHKRDIERVDGANTLYVPAWVCDCVCGGEKTVEHKDLMSNLVTNCGGEKHA